ncbi:hypothetical protein TNCV_3119831 [Trichonephila clavipes]|uniref:Uncharacterized protein n=1 Tax=Trichonephila clavipes TaxID=2585209 RepID=A0A8X6W9L5_TRICX|nr:hypothetical protein TNCV_3119831 [Trichonephila clavipes]
MWIVHEYDRPWVPRIRASENGFDARKTPSEYTRTCSLNQWVRSLWAYSRAQGLENISLPFSLDAEIVGDRGRVAIFPFGELRRAKIVLSPVWCSRPTTGVPLAHATMNFVGLDLTASDRWHQTTTTTTEYENGKIVL